MGVGFVALAALCVFLWRRHRRRKDTQRLADPEPEKTGSGGKAEGVIAPYEMEHSEQMKEMPTGREAHELPSRSSDPVELDGLSKDPTLRHELPSTRM
jgi:hypothetical protein